LRFEGDVAEITERRKALTASDDLNTAATSGSRTTATLPPAICVAKRFGLDCYSRTGIQAAVPRLLAVGSYELMFSS
jgi:hypothetical protein